MAVEIGTAANYLDLADKLNLFLTTNAALVAAGQEWELKQSGVDNSYIWKAPGLTGLEEIFCGIFPRSDILTDFHNWNVGIFTGFVPGDFNAQPGRITGAVTISLWNGTIPYWFVANGQRCQVVASVGYTYQHTYFGKFLAYGTPGQYPYPVVSAAMAGNSQSNRYSSTSLQTVVKNGNSARFFEPSGLAAAPLSWPGHMSTFNVGLEKVRPFDSGDIPLIPCMVLSTAGTALISSVYGEYDGLFWVPGIGAQPEAVVTISGVDYLIFPGGANSGPLDYAAIRLE